MLKALALESRSPLRKNSTKSENSAADRSGEFNSNGSSRSHSPRRDKPRDQWPIRMAYVPSHIFIPAARHRRLAFSPKNPKAMVFSGRARALRLEVTCRLHRLFIVLHGIDGSGSFSHHPAPDRRPLSRLRFQGELAVHQSHSFAHADQAQAEMFIGSLWIESHTLIADAQPHFASTARELHFESTHPAVLDSVLQGLLQH